MKGISPWLQLPLEERCRLHETFAEAFKQHGDVIFHEMILFIMCLLDQDDDMESVTAIVDHVRADIIRATLHEDVASALAPHIDGEH